ncbi:hypothetical protein ACIQ6Y_26795 [Streptomyces sp. NPDC096205]|uniref:hypothetical protein n=1 Tax=Streptomyces sp. NPDC096205 TaxID=3366081 RepID=UPI003805A74E
MSEYRQPDPGPYPPSAAAPATGGYDGQAVLGTPPNVYHPQVAGAVPAYDEYADPAAAHGWQNAYDETAQLPQVADDSTGVPTGLPAGRAATRRDARRAAARRDRRLLFAGGAIGVVSLAALVAGFSFGGSSDDDPVGRGDRTGPTVQDATDAADSSDSSGSGATEGPDGPASQATGPSAADASSAASPGASASSSVEPGAQDPTESGQPTASTAPTAGPSAPEASPTATDAKPGRGQGRPETKGPKG